MTKNLTTNLFEDQLQYSPEGFWFNLKDDEDLFFKLKEICIEEGAKVNPKATKEARTAFGDERVVFFNYISKNKLLFVLYLLKLWSPDDRES